MFNVFPEASVNTEIESSLELDSLRIFTGGLFQQSLGDLTVGKLNLNLTDDMVVNAYGRADVCGISVQVSNVLKQYNIVFNFSKRYTWIILHKSLAGQVKT